MRWCEKAPCYAWSSKYLKRKTLQSSKVLFWLIWDFSPTNAHIYLKKIILDRKVLKMQRYSSITLYISPKNPISTEKLIITFSKIQILPPIFFPESKTNWSNTFSKWISWQFSSNWLFQINVDSDLERAQTSEHCFILKTDIKTIKMLYKDLVQRRNNLSKSFAKQSVKNAILHFE